MVLVSTGSDERLVLDFDSTETIASFKQRLGAITGISAEQQIVVYAAKELLDERTLGDYYITEGSVVHLTVRLRGGMRAKKLRFSPPPFLVRNLTDTTGRKLFVREFPQFELFSLVGPRAYKRMVPTAAFLARYCATGPAGPALHKNRSSAGLGPSLFPLHRLIYKRLATGKEWYGCFYCRNRACLLH